MPLKHSRRRFVGAITAAGLFGLLAAGCGSGGGGDDDDQSPTIERFADEGNAHVDPSTEPVYNTNPPTSGPHYPIPTTPGFYTTAQRPGNLVHALEHGNIVIYYDPARVSTSQLDYLRALTAANTAPFRGVTATPRTDSRYVIIATAWTAWIRFQTLDQSKLEDFIETFIGNGPEN